MSDANNALIATRLAVAYMTAIAGEVSRRFPLDFLDLLLIGTIANSNLATATRTRRKSEAPVPERLGISRNAVSRALNVPLETVRRRVAVLIKKKILSEQADGLIFSPDNPMGVGNSAELLAFNMEMLRQLFRGLKANGIKLD